MGEVLRLVFTPLTCILWLVVGAFAGGLAQQIMRGRGGSFLGDFILGVLGSVVGSFVLGLLFNVNVDTSRGFGFLNPVNCIMYIAVSTFGAIVLIAIGRLITGRRV